MRAIMSFEIARSVAYFAQRVRPRMRKYQLEFVVLDSFTVSDTPSSVTDLCAITATAQPARASQARHAGRSSRMITQKGTSTCP